MTTHLRNLGRAGLLIGMSMLLAALAPAAMAAPPGSASDAAYVPGRLIVGFTPPVASAVTQIRNRTGLPVSSLPAAAPLPAEQILRLPAGQDVLSAAAAIRRVPGIAFAEPDYIAHAAGAWYPNDPGRTHRSRGWEKLQWNFLAGAGVNAPEAWANLIADHRAGARGVRVAIVDSGVAYRNWHQFKKSPDFRGTRFVAPCDLVSGRIKHGRCTDPYALDRYGHGTFVAGVVAEATNNRIGLTGLAYHATIMPVRVLNAYGDGDTATVAAGIRYAVAHHANVINLSLQFGEGVTAADVPSVASALQYAYNRGVIVVAAAGNDSEARLSYPARARTVISVAATTRDRCLADYSDSGQGLDLVAPGGGDDASLAKDPDCHPARNLPDTYQMSFRRLGGSPRDFSLLGLTGTSMAAPEVSAAAAMVIASRVIGRHPSPAAVLDRLERTATPLGGSAPNSTYGYGLVNLGAATSHTP